MIAFETHLGQENVPLFPAPYKRAFQSEKKKRTHQPPNPHPIPTEQKECVLQFSLSGPGSSSLPPNMRHTSTEEPHRRTAWCRDAGRDAGPDGVEWSGAWAPPRRGVPRGALDHPRDGRWDENSRPVSPGGRRKRLQGEACKGWSEQTVWFMKYSL